MKITLSTDRPIKVLYISYIFPPLGGSGVHRTAKFAKYLPRYNCDLTILSADDKTFYSQTGGEQYLAEIPPTVEVVRVTVPFFYRYLLKGNNTEAVSPSGPIVNPGLSTWLKRKISDYIAVPDPYIFWAIKAFFKALKIAGQQDIVFSTSAPYSDHLIGYFLKKFARKPWIAELRDPWSDNVIVFQNKPKIIKRINIWLEHKVLKSADAIIVVAEAMKDNITRRFTDIHADKMHVITNGFDPDDFSAIDIKGDRGIFEIASVGELYGSRFDAWKIFLEGYSAFRSQISSRARLSLTVIGLNNPEARDWTLGFAKANGFAEDITIKGYIDHAQALSVMINASALLLAQGSDESATGGIYPAKIFEYLKARRPIIAVVPSGHVSELIMKTNAGIICDYDADSVRRALIEIFNEWHLGKIRVISEEDLARFERNLLAKQLSEILHETSVDK